MIKQGATQCFICKQSNKARGSQSNAIDVRLAAKLIEFNRFVWFLIDQINQMIIESIEWSSNQSNFQSFFVIDSMSIRLHFDCIWLHLIAFDSI